MSNPPRLHVVGDNKTPNPENPYKIAFYTAIVVAIGGTIATMAVRWAFDRAARRKEQNEPQPQHMLPQFASMPMMTPGLPPGGTFVYVPPQQQMAPQNPWMMAANPMGQPSINFPQALQYPSMPTAPRPSRRAPAANDSAPDWFQGWAAEFAKQQDERFRALEAQLQYEEDEAS